MPCTRDVSFLERIGREIRSAEVAIHRTPRSSHASRSVLPLNRHALEFPQCQRGDWTWASYSIMARAHACKVPYSEAPVARSCLQVMYLTNCVLCRPEFTSKLVLIHPFETSQLRYNKLAGLSPLNVPYAIDQRYEYASLFISVAERTRRLGEVFWIEST